MMTKAIRWLKRAGAVLMIAAFFLPLSRCETTPVQQNAEPGAAAVNQKKEYDYFYAWEGVRDGMPVEKAAIILAFLWPALFLGMRTLIKPKVPNRALLFLEPVLAAGGAYVVFVMNFLNDLFIGFYVAMIAAFLYFAGAVLEIAGIADQFRKRKKV